MPTSGGPWFIEVSWACKYMAPTDRGGNEDKTALRNTLDARTTYQVIHAIAEDERNSRTLWPVLPNHSKACKLIEDAPTAQPLRQVQLEPNTLTLVSFLPPCNRGVQARLCYA